MFRVFKNRVLKRYNTFHTGGKTAFFAEINSTHDLKKAIDFANKNRVGIFILGGGSNILLPDKKINKLVLKINIKGIAIKNNKILAGAGETWDLVVSKAVSKKLGGIENLSLIPGTVGGAVYQNIGAYGVELKDVLESVKVFDIRTGSIRNLLNKECQFNYRDSVFQHQEGSSYLIVEAIIKLNRKLTFNLGYPGLASYFYKKSPDIQQVRGAVIRIRKSKLVYPTKNVGTVGSFFKNPVIKVKDYRLLAANHPDIKGRDIGHNLIKLSAGQLIEKAGWKGKRMGNVGVSSKHALVLVSYKGSTTKDIIKLSKTIQKEVKNKFNVRLEPEVKIIVG